MKTTAKEKKAVKSNALDVPSVPVAYENELNRLIEQTAYSKAESDGFKCSPEFYWLEAEKEVNHFY
jgi:hypothetical protein